MLTGLANLAADTDLFRFAGVKAPDRAGIAVFADAAVPAVDILHHRFAKKIADQAPDQTAGPPSDESTAAPGRHTAYRHRADLFLLAHH